MDVLIRDIDKRLVQSLGEQAKNKKLSRHAYIKLLLESAITMSHFNQERDRYTLALEKINDVVSLNEQRIHHLSNQLERLSDLMIRTQLM